MTDRRFEACIRKMVKGSREGLREIYEDCLPYIFSIVSGIVKNREDAEDVTSEFFIRLWNTAGRYRRGSGYKAYIATIARNMAIDHLRRTGREIPADFSAEESKEDTSYRFSEAAVRAAAEQAESFEDELVESLALKEALDRLKPSEREIINLKIMGDLTFREISEVLQIPMGTVTWRYRSAVEKMRRFGYE